jgi:hypothetical protein
MTADARAKILAYLTDGADKGPRYYKSKHIASELDLTPKEVGVNMGILQGRASDLRIEKWGYSKSTTWRVERVAILNGNGHSQTAPPVNGAASGNGHSEPAEGSGA